MGIEYEDAVVIKEAERSCDHTMITINCPDKTGLGCDLSRILLLFGLSIAKGDFATDGTWCYIVLWVVGKATTRWELLKMRLLEVCPTCTAAASDIYYYRPEFQQRKPSDGFLLKFWCLYDRKGLLHDVTEVLCELELTIKKVKILTAPDGRVMDLFYITDTRELLHTKKRQKETIDSLKAALGDDIMSCEIELAGPEVSACLQSFLPESITEDMFSLELQGNDSSDVLGSEPVPIKLDNTRSPSHTLLHIVCQDHKGLIYDIMRTLKDYNLQVSHGRFFAKSGGNFEVELLIMQADGKKITDSHKQNALCARLRMELLHPLRVEVLSRGPDTEVLVANPVELSGRGRPLVFHDITLAIKILNICIFSAEIGKHRIHDREWEVYRILLEECDGKTLHRDEIKECVRKKLMGWE